MRRRCLPYSEIQYTCLDGRRNMAVDCLLLDLAEQNPGSAFVRFYTWQGPTLSMGRLESPEAVDADAAGRDGTVVVRRPTGGRVVLHGDDLTYTVVLPRPDDAGLCGIYRLVSGVLVDGLSRLGADVEISRGKAGRPRMDRKPCFASVSRYEVTYRGRKVVGSAQRIGERAVLQHGSIPLGPGYLRVVDYMNLPSQERVQLLEEMKSHTACLSEVVGRCVDPGDVAAALASAFRRRLGCDPHRLALNDLKAGEPSAYARPVDALNVVSPRHKSP